MKFKVDVTIAITYYRSNHISARDIAWKAYRISCGFMQVMPHGSTLSQVTACCLAALSHCLNQYWLLISEVLWHSSESNQFEYYIHDITATSPTGANELNKRCWKEVRASVSVVYLLLLDWFSHRVNTLWHFTCAVTYIWCKVYIIGDDLSRTSKCHFAKKYRPITCICVLTAPVAKMAHSWDHFAKID